MPGRWDRRRVLVGRLTAARKKLGRWIAGLRAHLADLFGAAAAAGLFVLRGATSEAAEELSRQAAWVVDWLYDASKPLPESPYPPSMDDRRRWAEPVAAADEALGPALARASLARKRAEAAKAERRRLRGPYDDLFVAVACWFEATYRVAGREDRCGAVRPSKRRKGLLLRDDRRRRDESEPVGPEVAPLTLVESPPQPETPQPRPQSSIVTSCHTGGGCTILEGGFVRIPAHLAGSSTRY